MKKYILPIFLLLTTALQAQIKISDLPTYTGNPSGTYVPVVVGGITKKFDLGRVVDTTFFGTKTWVYSYAAPLARTITINGTAYSLTADRTWNVGTVTSVGAGYGINGGTITTTGILSIDTSSLSTRAWRQKGIDSLKATTTLQSTTQTGATTNIPITLGDFFASDTAIFYGNSITAGAQATPLYYRWTSQLSYDIGVIEWNRGISGTRMQHGTVGDSCMFDRIYTIPYKRAGLRYLFFSYGVNDANHGYDTIIFKSSYQTVIDSAIARGWSISNIILLTPSYQSVALNAAGSKFVTATKTVARTNGLTCIDMYAAMRDNGGSSLIYSDSIHPTTAGHLVLKQAVLAGIPNVVKAGKLTVNGNGIFKTKLTVGTPLLDSFTFNVTGSTNLSGDAYVNGLRLGRGAGTNTGQNTVFGLDAAKVNTTGISNTIIGYQSLYQNTSGGQNVMIGTFTGYANTTASNNTVVGYDAFQNNTTGTQNAAFGALSLTGGAGATGNYNTGIGYSAGFSVTSGQYNSLLGYNSGYNIRSASDNTAVGRESLYNLQTGSQNAAFGEFSLYNATASNNSAFGRSSLQSLTSGTNNVGLGHQSGFNISTGDYNITIGASVNVPTASASRQLNIGNIIFGTGVYNSTTPSATATTDGQVGIGGEPVASARLAVTSTTMGFLPPRMTTTQRTAISSPAEGLCVYDYDLHKLYVYDGTTWQAAW